MKKILFYLLGSLNCLLALALLLSYVAMYLSPTIWWMPSFFGFFFFLFFLFNLAFLLYWLIRRKWWWSLVSLLVLLPSVFILKTVVQFQGKNDVQGVLQLRMLTYNVNLFGLKSKPKEQVAFQQIAHFINSEKFDVACLQEYFTIDTAAYSEKTFNAQLSNYPYRYVHYNVVKGKKKLGIATYSKHKIVGQGNIGFYHTANAAIYTDIELNDSLTVRVYNVHLQSIRLKDDERNVILEEGFLLRHDQKTLLMSGVFAKMKTAFAKRAQQVELVAEHISASPYPVIVCGDFNDTPVSYSYRKMRGKLSDGFMDAGRGIMSTYRSIVPSFRIDYTLYDPMFVASACFCPDVTFSDHFPLICRLVATE